MITIVLHEFTVASNWRGLRKPDWVDERTRLYSGVTLTRDGVSYSEMLAAFDGSKTTVYLTNNGFHADEVGPAVYEHEGKRAAYSKAVSECLAKFGEVKFI
jgi:hypothetical protein